MAEQSGAAQPRDGAPALTLLTRIDCHLCDEFHRALMRWDDGRGHFQLNVVDVDSDPALSARFGLRVPVLLFGEQELCALRFDEERLGALTAVD